MRPLPPALLVASLLGLWGSAASAAPARLIPVASDWFYADASGERSHVASDGTLGGTTVWKTGVVLARAADSGAAASLVKLPGLQSIDALDAHGLVLRLDFGEEADDFAISRALHERDDITWSHPDLAFVPTAHAFPDDPYVGAQWHLENVGQSGGTVDADIDAETAWALATGTGVLVSILDSGVDHTHPDLRTTCGYNYIEDDTDCYPADGNAHGTAAAGLVAGIGNNGVGVAGVAYDADIYGVRLIGGATTYSDLHGAFTESVDAGAAVLNNSWGFSDGCGSYALPGAIREAYEYAEEQGRGGLGSVIVFSAGNGDCDMSGDGLQAHSTIVSVAAFDRNDRKEGYSSYGRGVDVGGPSGGVLTTDISGGDGYGNYEGDNNYTPGFSGTSASAPIVSGVLALMFSANPDLTAADARAVLNATADKVQVDTAEYDATGWSPTYGHGRVNAGAAVIAVANTRPGAPEPTGPTSAPYADRVVLQWTAATDPDGDPLQYRVEVSVSDRSLTDTGHIPTPTVHELDSTTDTFVDITELVAVDQSVAWSVRAEDAWTTSEAAEGAPFTVRPIPEPPEDTAEPEDTDPNTEPEDTAVGGGTTVSPEGPAKDGQGCATASGTAMGLLWLGVTLAGLRSRSEHVAPGEVHPRTHHPL